MRLAASFVVALCVQVAFAGEKSRYLSHPPMRPLPTASERPLSAGRSYFVDATKGRDDAAGSKTEPWKTLAHAVKQLKPGNTLYLRGGVFYEHVALSVSGTTKEPIVVRSYPGELAIIDGGLREFYESPATAWEPAPGGVTGEFRSVKPYNDLGSAGDQTHLLGNFGDSMIPLQGYKFMSDLRSANVYFNLPVNVGPEGNIYCGPGICHDLKTGHIHVRLAHTKMKYLPADDNYSGETDPRKVPLVIAGHQGGSPLSLRNVRHVRVQDLVVRGSRGPTVEVEGAEDIEFDGLTVYGGSTCFVVKETVGLRILNTACRGIAAPWTFRGSLKYRAIEARIFSASGWQPTPFENRDFELAYSEFTDCVDGVFIGNVKRVRFHHNLVENISDDAVFITATTAYDGVTHGGDLHIYQNRFARCLTTFAFGVGHGRQKVIEAGQQTGSGAHIYRNAFDYRQPVLYHQPASEKEPQEVTSKGRFASDHGSPAWEPMNIYHNTIIADEKPRYTYGTWGLGGAMGRGTRRRVFNNVIVQLQELPGYFLPPTTTDFQADGNLFWSFGQGDTQEKLFAKFRQSKEFVASKEKYPPGWGASDRVADPKFESFSADWKVAADLRLQADSPALSGGVVVPKDWLDPLRNRDQSAPDLGAVPRGLEPWHVGQNGRLTVLGETKALPDKPALPPLEYTPRAGIADAKLAPAALVEGYPAFDSPLLSFAFRQQGIPVEVMERAWLAPEKYSAYRAVILTGNLLRAKVTPSKFSADDLKKIESYLKNGGVLLLTISGRDALQTPEGRKFLTDITGGGAPVKSLTPKVLDATHPWVKHVKPASGWLTELGKKNGSALAVGAGENVLGEEGSSLLYRRTVGKGTFIYLGWTIHDSLPYTREKVPTVEQERMYEAQMRILQSIAASVATSL